MAARQFAAQFRQWHRTLRERHLRPYVFVHINKTGGSSVEQALGIRLDHSTAVEKRAQLGRRAWDDKYKFAFVRNPWDKVVSHYHYRVKTNQTGLGDASVPFSDWLRLCYVDRDPRYYDQPRMFQAQADWLREGDGELLVDFVGRFENLAEDFAVVTAALGLSAELDHVKPSARGSYQQYFDDATREIVAQAFSADIQLFDYRF